MIPGDIISSPRVADYVDADGSVMLVCDGRILVPGTYPVLDALLAGAPFGVAGQLPDFGSDGMNNGYMPIGASPAGGYALGAKAGSGSHDHACAAFTMGHALAAGATGTGGFAFVAAGALPVASAGHTHTLAIDYQPPHGAQPDVDVANSLPPMLANTFFIKAA